ncbi:MAG: ribonucleoside triphosphate reductase [Lachnospiraceae bacterium]|nr:ribonucleoside triphosphate reductase [Lachnospiraceae bacterium]
MVKGTLINCSDTVNEYVNREDWRIKANANSSFSAAGLVNNLAGKVIANWWLDEVYSPAEGMAHREGDYHIHDLDVCGAYCCGHDLQKLLQEGFNGVISRVGAKPPKHFREALYQMANYLGILQAEWAGAQAFSSFDTLLAPYVFYDMMIEGIDEKAIRKAIVNFVYNLNVPSRWGQSPFTNITIDWTVPSVLKDLVPMRGDVPYFVGIYNNSLKEKIEAAKQSTVGESKYLKFINEIRARLNDFESDDEMLMYSLTYKNFQKEMDIINRCFYQVMSDGDKDGQPFTFPIPTINITEDFDWDNPNCEYLFENTAKYGHSYFQNFIGSQYLRDENSKLTVKDPNAYSPNDLRSMCCRLQLDKKALRKRGGGLFGSDSQTGSIGVVTINMARLGYLYKGDFEGMKKRLKELCDMASSTLEKKRKKVVELNEMGLFPYTRRYINTFDTFFSTIGVNGMNEMIRNFTNDEYDIADSRGQQMAKELLDFINVQLLRYQDETGNLYNLEATPAEGTTYRFAREDAKRFDDIIQAGYEDAPYYTNSSQLPVDFSADPFAVLELQDDLQKKYTGGTVLHLYMNERVSSPEVCKQLVKKVLTNYRLPYISITPSFSVCPKHGYISGDHEFCPLCDKEIMLKHADELDFNK